MGTTGFDNTAFTLDRKVAQHDTGQTAFEASKIGHKWAQHEGQDFIPTQA
jgi:hypothetical protein